MSEEKRKPLVWIVDSERSALGESLSVFDAGCSAFRYFEAGEPFPGDGDPPDAVVFSAEIAGGPGGEAFARLRAETAGIPLLAAARVRSLAQAVAFFRAGADDYLSLPFDPGELADRLSAACAANIFAPPTVLVEVERLGSASGSADPVRIDRIAAVANLADGAGDEDILADLSREESRSEDPGGKDPGSGAAENELSDADKFRETDAGDSSGSGGPGEAEPEPVDGLPIPSLWEELPCGLVVFDSTGDPVFSNALALDLFGLDTLGGLRDALEPNRRLFKALGQNQNPLPDNQWPHAAAFKAKAARSAVVSIERSDRRRVWLRIDCLPHLTDGKVSRLSMTLVNMTGELPPPAGEPKRARKRRGAD
ncbi:MAG: hypothetical protein LBT97_10100 [Planctomycetota bacterium]|jgi:CheY-like chemotaxis protein|nr:hypothetical protein [Planctomycetota bacterium]